MLAQGTHGLLHSITEATRDAIRAIRKCQKHSPRSRTGCGCCHDKAIYTWPRAAINPRAVPWAILCHVLSLECSIFGDFGARAAVSQCPRSISRTHARTCVQEEENVTQPQGECGLQLRGRGALRSTTPFLLPTSPTVHPRLTAVVAYLKV